MTATIPERVAELVRIPSVNPMQAGPKSGPGGEQDLGEHLADRLDAMGAIVELDEVEPGRSNVYASFEGDSDRTVTIDTHLDTVGVEHMTRDPFDGTLEDGRVYGRGSVDTKASFAIVMHVLEELQAEGKRPVPTVNLVGTVAEEMGGFKGATAYADWLRGRGDVVDQLIVAEPTLCAPVYGHKGGLGLEVCVHGHAAHSSKPHLGANAISGAAKVIGALVEEQARLDAGTAATAVGLGTLQVTEIGGGLGRNIIPDTCNLYADRRIAPGEDPDEIFEQLTEMITDAAAPLDVDVVCPYGEGFPAFYQDPESPLIQQVGSLAEEEPQTASYGSNALMYADIANEVIVFGPGSIDQAHQAVEWVDIAELERAAAIYRSLFRAA